MCGGSFTFTINIAISVLVTVFGTSADFDSVNTSDAAYISGNDINFIRRSSTYQKLSEARLSRVFCNYNVISNKRFTSAKFSFENIDVTFCTDCNYDYAELSNYHLTAVSSIKVISQRRLVHLPKYIAFNNIKVDNPNVRTFLTLGESKDITFTSLVTNEERGRSFVTSIVYNLRLWGFDGVNLKWLHPPKPSFMTQLLMSLRNAFEMDFKKQLKKINRLLLGVILSGQSGVASDRYEVFAISSLVDSITLQMFDDSPSYNLTTAMTSTLFETNVSNFKTTNNTRSATRRAATTTTKLPVTTLASTTPPSTTTISTKTTTIPENQPTVTTPTTATTTATVILPETNISVFRSSNIDLHDILNDLDVGELQDELKIQEQNAGTKQYIIAETIKEWLALGADKSKLIIGLSLIGQGYILKDKSVNGVGAPAKGPSPPATSNIPGQIFFYEMCELAQKGTVQRVSNIDDSPYWYNDAFWISYEDIASISQKIEYLRSNYIFGVMVFSQSEDDFRGTNCGLGTFPVSSMIHNMSNVQNVALLPTGIAEWISFCTDAAAVASPTMYTLLMGLYFHSFII